MLSKSRVFFALLIAAVAVATVLPARIPSARGQETHPVKVEFTAYEGNPVITVGEAAAWDAGFVFSGNVLYQDGMFHMLYSGGADATAAPAVGYATSEDGLHWAKYEGNPVLQMDPAITRAGIPSPKLVLDGDTWIVFFNFVQYQGSSPTGIMRATAPAPTGPWTIGATPVLEKGSGQDWDVNIDLASVTMAEGEYALYYTSPYQNVGRATSPEGTTWTKHNDPATTEPQFANSDPVFTIGEAGSWDDLMLADNIVRYGDHGWEMFYAGNGSAIPGTVHMHIGYATSPDGIVWTRFGDWPVLSPLEGYSDLIPSSFVIVDGAYYLYYSMSPAENVWNQVGVAIGTVTWD